MAAKLLQFQFVMEHNPGETHVLVELLSPWKPREEPEVSLHKLSLCLVLLGKSDFNWSRLDEIKKSHVQKDKSMFLLRMNSGNESVLSLMLEWQDTEGSIQNLRPFASRSGGQARKKMYKVYAISDNIV